MNRTRPRHPPRVRGRSGATLGGQRQIPSGTLMVELRRATVRFARGSGHEQAPATQQSALQRGKENVIDGDADQENGQDGGEHLR